MSAPSAPSPTVVRARPRTACGWSVAAALVILAAFSVTAVRLPSSGDGYHFFLSDQLGIFGVGLVLAALALLPLRIRMAADSSGVRTRGPLGGDKIIPWSVVQAVEFRPKWRWARLVLPADETVSLYAVQRWDGERAVAAMRGLRALHGAAQDSARAQ